MQHFLTSQAINCPSHVTSPAVTRAVKLRIHILPTLDDLDSTGAAESSLLNRAATAPKLDTFDMRQQDCPRNSIRIKYEFTSDGRKKQREQQRYRALRTPTPQTGVKISPPRIVPRRSERSAEQLQSIPGPTRKRHRNRPRTHLKQSFDILHRVHAHAYSPVLSRQQASQKPFDFLAVTDYGRTVR